jgi:hypothetical protein
MTPCTARARALPVLVLLLACGGADDRTPATDAVLRRELLAMGAADQRIREDIGARTEPDTALMQRMMRVDSGHTARLGEIVAAHGWPGPSLVGEKASNAAFLIVQHSPSEAFRKEMLDLMRAAAVVGEARLSDVALLTDRVLTGDGEPQLYGTQFHIVDGELVPYPIAEAETLEQRRAEMGLTTMADYVKALSKMYGGRVVYGGDTAAVARDSVPG